VFDACSPIIIEVPQFASLRGEEREIAVLRSDDGQAWKEHVPPASEDAVHEMLEGHFVGASHTHTHTHTHTHIFRSN